MAQGTLDTHSSPRITPMPIASDYSKTNLQRASSTRRYGSATMISSRTVNTAATAAGRHTTTTTMLAAREMIRRTASCNAAAIRPSSHPPTPTCSGHAGFVGTHRFVTTARPASRRETLPFSGPGRRFSYNQRHHSTTTTKYIQAVNSSTYRHRRQQPACTVFCTAPCKLDPHAKINKSLPWLRPLINVANDMNLFFCQGLKVTGLATLSSTFKNKLLQYCTGLLVALSPGCIAAVTKHFEWSHWSRDLTPDTPILLSCNLRGRLSTSRQNILFS